MKKKIAVIFGGRSGEHEVSIRSAKTVVEQIDHERYDVIPINIAHDGRWLSPAESVALLPPTTRQVFTERFGSPATQVLQLTGDAALGGLVALCEECGKACPRSETLSIDCIFPVLHGTFGEDGTIQGLF